MKIKVSIDNEFPITVIGVAKVIKSDSNRGKLALRVDGKFLNGDECKMTFHAPVCSWWII